MSTTDAAPPLSTPLVVGVDLGGTKMAAALVTADGALAGPLASVPTPARSGPEAVLDAIASVVDTVVSAGTHQAHGAPVAVSAVGVGSAGVVNVSTGTIVSATDAITGWTGTLVATGVRSRLIAQGYGDMPVHVENDVDAYAGGEAWLGAGRDAGSVLVVAVGTGFGGSVVINGTTVRGAHYVAGEIGHVPAPGAENEMCTCGRRGHLEAIAAGPQIHRRYLAAGGDPEVANAFEVEQRADAGDPIASLVYRDSAIALGKVLAGVVAVLDPERVVLSGGLARAGELWWAPLRETFRAELIDPLADVPLVRAELGTNAPIIGAARGALRLLGAAA